METFLTKEIELGTRGRVRENIMRYEWFLCFGISLFVGIFCCCQALNHNTIIFNSPFLQRGKLYTCHFWMLMSSVFHDDDDVDDSK